MKVFVFDICFAHGIMTAHLYSKSEDLYRFLIKDVLSSNTATEPSTSKEIDPKDQELSDEVRFTCNGFFIHFFLELTGKIQLLFLSFFSHHQVS
jgi:hypothetical protein